MDTTAVFMDNVIVWQGRKILYDSLFTKEFYCYSDRIIKRFSFGLIVDNVVYLYFIRQVLSIEYFIKVNAVEYADIRIRDWKRYKVVLNALKICKVNYKSTVVAYINKSYLPRRLAMLLSMLYLICVQSIQKRKSLNVEATPNVWVCRADAVRNKLFHIDNTLILEETKIGFGNIYSSLPLMKRICCVVRAFLHARKEYDRMIKVLCNNSLYDICDLATAFFSKRIVHIFFWGEVIEENIKQYNFGNDIYTGNYTCPYSNIEFKIAKKCKKKLIVIPHGMEISYKLPAGLPGDLFYTTSKNAEIVLNQIYETDKFLYDSSIIAKAYCIENDNNETRKKRIVYFTDGNGSYFDLIIVENLYKNFHKSGIVFSIKYHANENMGLYSAFNDIDVETDINVALVGNICVARDSTVLVEALYNNSISIQVILDGDSRVEAKVIPSMDDPKIIHVNSLPDLNSCLEKLIEQQA